MSHLPLTWTEGPAGKMDAWLGRCCYDMLYDANNAATECSVFHSQRVFNMYSFTAKLFAGLRDCISNVLTEQWCGAIGSMISETRSHT